MISRWFCEIELIEDPLPVLVALVYKFNALKVNAHLSEPNALNELKSSRHRTHIRTERIDRAKKSFPFSLRLSHCYYT
jgi:hypothetical protein